MGRRRSLAIALALMACSSEPNPTGSLRALSPMASPRAGHTTVRLPDGRVALIGGYEWITGDQLRVGWTSSAEIFEPATSTTKRIRDMPYPPDGPVAAATPDGRIVVVGNQTAFVWDHTKDAWSQHGGGPNTTTSAVIALPSGRILAIGGSSTGDWNNAQRSVWSFDPESSAWASLAPMRTGRILPVAAVLGDGRVLVAGGVDARAELSSAEIFDPSTGTWTATAPMSRARTGTRATTLGDGRVLVYGAADSAEPVADLFDPGSGTWRPINGFGGGAMRLRPLSGARALASSYRPVRLYLFEVDTFRSVVDAPQLGDGHQATVLSDGKVLFTGGAATTPFEPCPAGRGNCYATTTSMALCTPP